jgi:hypothetical protein
VKPRALPIEILVKLERQQTTADKGQLQTRVQTEDNADDSDGAAH